MKNSNKIFNINLKNIIIFFCILIVIYYIIIEIISVLDKYIFYVKPTIHNSDKNDLRMLLFSNTKMHKYDSYLDHGILSLEHFIKQHNINNVLHISYANPDDKGGLYTKDAQRKHYEEVVPLFNSLGANIELLNVNDSVQQQINKINDAQCIFMSGGNTFLCLRALQQPGVMNTLRNKILNGTPYIGSSAGSVIVSPTIQTTNDMPICYLNDYSSLNILPFQMNMHYDKSHNSKIREYLKENRKTKQGKDSFVICLCEGSLLHVCGQKIEICGYMNKPASKLYLDKNDTLTETIIKTGSRLDQLF